MSWVQFLMGYAFARALQLSETRGQMKRPVSTSRSPARTCSGGCKSKRHFIHFNSGLPGSSSVYSIILHNRTSQQVQIRNSSGLKQRPSTPAPSGVKRTDLQGQVSSTYCNFNVIMYELQKKPNLIPNRHDIFQKGLKKTKH